MKQVDKLVAKHPVRVYWKIMAALVPLLFVAALLSSLGNGLFLLIIGCVAGYFGYRFLKRQQPPAQPQAQATPLQRPAVAGAVRKALIAGRQQALGNSIRRALSGTPAERKQIGR